MLGLIGSGNPSQEKITPKNIPRTSLEKSASLIIFYTDAVFIQYGYRAANYLFF